MKVKLLAHTPEPDKNCAAAAFTTYSKREPSDILESMTEEKAREVIKRVVSCGHHSVIEHASFTFAIEGISRACSHQLVRHRIASYSQQSQRYVKFDSVNYVTPGTIAEKKEALEEYGRAIGEAIKAYDTLLKLGIPAEDARYLLPNSAHTNLVMSMNARELVHFFKLRCCERAQWEIKELAVEMLREVKKAAPIIFENAGPNCVNGPCPEGKAACGKIGEIREKFKKL